MARTAASAMKRRCQMLSLCVLDVALCAPGTEVTVLWGRPGTPQKAIRATVAPAPYKKDNRRLDVSRLAAEPAAHVSE